MISCACGRMSIGKMLRVARRVESASRLTICGVSDDVDPGVHDVGIAREAAGLARAASAL